MYNGFNGVNGGGGAGTPPPVGNSDGRAAVNGQDSKIVRFATNVPEILAVKYSDGKEVEGRFGPQWMYSLTDGRVMYVCGKVVEQINLLEIRPNEPFAICKAEVREPGKRKAETRWKVERINPPQPQVAPPVPAPRPVAVPSPAPAQAVAPVNGHAAAYNPPPAKTPMDDAVVIAVRMVQRAMKETGEQWSDGSRQDLVSTILITGSREGWVGPWRQGGAL